MIDISSLKESLKSQLEFNISDSILDEFISMGEYVKLEAQEYVIAPNTTDKSVWITGRGVTKALYFDGKKEYVLGFSGPGTITLSPISFSLGKASFCSFQTITDCEMLRIKKADFYALMSKSHEFSLWMFEILMGQFCALELKAQMLSEGDIHSNYKKVVKRQMVLDNDGFDPNRPSLLSIISSKDLASYLGITQSYLSNIRKAIIDKERGKDTQDN